MFVNDDGEKEIIDGQQRITTIFLLLRAFYNDIENSDSKELLFLKNEITKLIWKTSYGEIQGNKRNCLINSKVAFDNAWESFLYIMKNGKPKSEDDKKKKKHYEKNYCIL